MDRYEYKVIPAPEKGVKAKGVKTPADRFAHAMELEMNALGADGWEYWRAECLPSTERAGLASSKVTDRHMLVFRRLLAPTPARAAVPEAPMRRAAPEPQPLAAPAPQPEPEPEPEHTAEPARMPVFTRRLEMAREQREEALQRGEGAEDTSFRRED